MSAPTYTAARTGEPIAKVKASALAQWITTAIIAAVVWALAEYAGLRLDDATIAAATVVVSGVVISAVSTLVAWIVPLLPSEIAGALFDPSES